jgi:hypothetical protein
LTASIGTPADFPTAIGDQLQVIRLGAVVGLGIACDGEAIMTTMFPAEAKALGEELIRQADG